MRHQMIKAGLVSIAMALGVSSGASGAEPLLPGAVMSQVSESTPAPAAETAQELRAGPIRLKLEDGEIRYLRVGDKEIVRRIYFAVRDGNWATAMPKFSKISVEKGADHFTVNLAADCRIGAIDYHWSGVITGAADGKITFAATGAGNSDFDSNRIGLCVLFGVPSLAMQSFATDGTIAKGEFPLLVSPTLVASKFHRLEYATADGLKVACALEGATFDMEDQRNWGDNSWKAYAPLPYAYKQIGKGDAKSETVTITVSGAANAQAPAQDPVRVKIAKAIEGAKLPDLAAPPAGKVEPFTAFSFAREKYKAERQIAWSYIPTTHLPDADTIMENLPSVMYQAKTVRSVSPECTMRVGPIGLSDAGIKDPRANEPLAAALTAGMMKYLALGGVDEAAFAVGDGAPAAVLEAIRPYAKQTLLDVQTEPANSHRLLAFAAGNEAGVALFLVNTTAHACHAEVTGLNAKQAQVLHVGPGAGERAADVAGETLKVELAPYEVVRVTTAR